MIKHSIRSFKRQRSYLVINVLGLSIGIACSLLIALYIINESTYDRYNVKNDRLFRTILNGKIGGQEVTIFASPAILGPTIIKEFPEIEDYCRMSGGGPTVLEYDGQTFTEDDLIEVDSSFFNLFSIPVLKGNVSNLLNEPHKAVLAEATALKIFGDENPIDKQIRIGTDTIKYTITGVMADIPEKSHFKANVLTSFMTNPRSKNPVWLSNSFSTYLLLKPNADYRDVDAKFHELIVKYVGPEVEKYMGISIETMKNQGNIYRFFLQNIRNIHLDPSITQHFKPAIDPKYLQIFGVIAIMIVLIAAINFMNLATAQASRRAREVGIKKVGGSTRSMLIGQFLSESFLLALLATVLAIVIVSLTLPYFNNLLEVQLNLGLLSVWYTIPALLAFALLVGIMAGSYPAFYLSSFNPYHVLKGSIKTSSKNGVLRRILVVFQFAVSILLIIGTMIMYRQINYMLNKDVGFNKEQLLVINRADALGQKMKAFKDAVREIPGVKNIASSTAVPGRNNNNNGYNIEGRSDETFLLNTAWVDYDFLETYQMKLSSGRFFDESFSADKEACIINESAIRNFSIEGSEKTRFTLPGEEGKFRSVIGVVGDFNFVSLRNPVEPYIMLFQSENFLWGYITVRLDSKDYASTISAIEGKWKEFAPAMPMQYYFMDEDFEKMYLQEKQNAQMAIIFAILAIFVAALGLFGLTSYTIEQRTKEIGVRKAMGSSVGGIYVEISREIVILVTVAALIAWPAIYYWAGIWLENFYFRINPGMFSFVLGLVIAVIVALSTISYRVMKAANVNPASSLKYE